MDKIKYLENKKKAGRKSMPRSKPLEVHIANNRDEEDEDNLIRARHLDD